MRESERETEKESDSKRVEAIRVEITGKAEQLPATSCIRSSKPLRSSNRPWNHCPHGSRSIRLHDRRLIENDEQLHVLLPDGCLRPVGELWVFPRRRVQDTDGQELLEFDGASN